MPLDMGKRAIEVLHWVQFVGPVMHGALLP
jgi:hypothetical protein